MNWDVGLDAVLDSLTSNLGTAWVNQIDMAAALGRRGITPVASSPSTEITSPVDGQLCYVASTRSYMKYDGVALVWVPFAGGSSGTANTILSGTVNPTSGQGSDGDFFLNTSSSTLFGPKASGAWPGSGTLLIGPAGAAGSAGSTGATGSAGTNGNSVLNGTSAPSSGQGANGDFYLNTATNILFGPKASGAWPGSGVSIVGPTGANGTAGTAGTPGTNGNTVLSGSANPTSGQGVNGDFYLNTTTTTLFGPKASGAWPGSGTSLIGPALQPWQFSVMAYGAKGDGTTDDTTSIQAAIDAAFAYAVANSFYAEVIFPIPAAYYLVNGTPTHARFGNSILTIPIQLPTANKVTLAFLGSKQGAALPHWQQTVRQINPVTLRTTNSYAISSNYGEPCILGGPNFAPLNGYGTSATLFNNICIHMDGISFMGPNNANAGIAGADFVGCAEMHVKTGSYLVDVPPGAGIAPGGGGGYAFGLRTPANGNNDLNVIESWSTEGLTYGMFIYEHASVLSSRVIYCFDGYAIAGAFGGVGAQHCVSLVNASAEGCTNHIAFVGNGAKIHGVLDIEDTTVSIQDQSSSGLSTGDLWLTGAYAFTNLPAATSQVKITNSIQPRGAVTAPTVPATTVAFQNVFGRDASVVVSGGTVTDVAVDGVSTGLTTGFIHIPSGKNITLTYSAAPTWKWWLS